MSITPDYWPDDVCSEVKIRRLVELDIATRVIDALLDAGYLVEVSDDRLNADNSICLKKSGDRTAIIRSLMTSDDNVLFAYDKISGKCRGWVLLIYGNDHGETVISDYTVGLEKVLAPVNKYADEVYG